MIDMPTLPTWLASIQIMFAFPTIGAFWAQPGDAGDLPTGRVDKDFGGSRILRYPHDTSWIPNLFDMLQCSQHFRKLSSYPLGGLMNVHLLQVGLVTGWTMEKSVLAGLARDLVPSQLLKLTR